MGKAHDWALVVFIGAAWSEGAWALSCGDEDYPGPVCVDGESYDSLYDAVVYAEDVGVSIVEVTTSYDPAEDSHCADLSLGELSAISLVALADEVLWPGIKVQGGALALTGGIFVGACGLSYSERVTEYDSATSTSSVVDKSFTTAAQLIAVESSVSLDGVTFDYRNAAEVDDSLGALFLWDSALDAFGGTSFAAYPRQGAVEIVAHNADVSATFTDVSFSENVELALALRLTLAASMERVNSDGLADEPSFVATLTDVFFNVNSPGYGVTADITADELTSLTITRGLHVGTGDGIALYTLDTHLTMTDTVVNSYERGVNVGSSDGMFTGALDESDDVKLEITGGSFTSIHNANDHGGAITASSGEIEISGVTASDLSSKYAPFVKAYYAPKLLVEDVTLTSFTLASAPSAAIHAEQVDTVTLRRVSVCDGQSSTTGAGGGLALYVNGKGGPNQTVEVHNLAFWGNRFGAGMFPAAVYAEQIQTLWVKHSTFVGSDEPTGRDAYAIKLYDTSMRTRFTFTSDLVQGLTKGVFTLYGDADSVEYPTLQELDYTLFEDVDYPLIAESSAEFDPYHVTANVAVNTESAGFWSTFNPVDCTTPPLLGFGSYAIDKGDPRDGNLDKDGSPPDLGAYGGQYATELHDGDADGYPIGVDCDDADATVHPRQPDVRVDGVDANCDGVDAPWDDPLYEAPAEDTGGDDTGGDDTGRDDTGTTGRDSDDLAQDEPLQFDYSGGRSCGGGALDTGASAGLLFLGTFLRRRRRQG